MNKDIKDFLFWLAENGLLHPYWSVIQLFCDKKDIWIGNFIKGMDVNKEETLFHVLEESDYWYNNVRKSYIQWLNTSVS